MNKSKIVKVLTELKFWFKGVMCPSVTIILSIATKASKKSK